MDSSNCPKLASTTERDMDLLFLEEFECSDEFVEWFLQKISQEIHFIKNAKVVNRKTIHSVTDDTGESDIVIDIECSLNGDTKSIKVLIENKIDAPFQKEQPERYQQRVQNELAKRKCDIGHCVLMAPQDYIESNSGSGIFDATVSYESVISYLKMRINSVTIELGRRFEHKIELLEQSIYKYRRGYTPVIDTDVTNFWKEYYSLANQRFPILKMKRPGDKPSEGHWIHFTQAITSPSPLPRCVIKHKLFQGSVDLEFADWGKHREVVESKISLMLAEKMIIKTTGKSLSISISTPSIDVKYNFNTQRDAIVVGLDAAYCLLSWFNHNADSLRKMAIESKL